MERQAVIDFVGRYLSNTQGFIALKKARADISESPQIKARIAQFNDKQNSLYEQMLTQSQAQSIMEELNGEYEQLCRIPLVKDYFNAIDQFNDTINRLMKDINASLEQNLIL